MLSYAKLEVSACCRFAKLSNSLGEYIIIWSKTYARFMVKSGLKHRVITPPDAEMLYLQIRDSKLPDVDGFVSLEVQTAIRNINEALSTIPDYELGMEMIANAITLIERRNNPSVH